MTSKETINFLKTIKVSDATYWYAYWFIDLSVEELNKLIYQAYRNLDQFRIEMYCKVLALKHLYSITPKACPECSGTGEVDELDIKAVTSRTETPPYHKVICDECEGSGKIKENKMDKKECSGCYNNDYNYGLGKECWSLGEAELIMRQEIHIDQVPPYKQPFIKLPNCYRKQRYCYINKIKEE